MKFEPYTLADLMAFKIICQPGVMMRREVLEQAGFLDIQFHYLLDHHLWLRMAAAGADGLPAAPAGRGSFPSRGEKPVPGAEFGKEALRVAAWLQNQPEYAADSITGAKCGAGLTG